MYLEIQQQYNRDDTSVKHFWRCFLNHRICIQVYTSEKERREESRERGWTWMNILCVHHKFVSTWTVKKKKKNKRKYLFQKLLSQFVSFRDSFSFSFFRWKLHFDQHRELLQTCCQYLFLYLSQFLVSASDN